MFEPNLYLYDAYPGGIGQSAPLFRLRSTLLTNAAKLLDACPCHAGCPSCVGPAGEIGDRGKEAARRILTALLEGQ
jgi:DEAD/DEAH box helicase domain-containing protein